MSAVNWSSGAEQLVLQAISEQIDDQSDALAGVARHVRTAPGAAGAPARVPPRKKNPPGVTPADELPLSPHRPHCAIPRKQPIVWLKQQTRGGTFAPSPIHPKGAPINVD